MQFFRMNSLERNSVCITSFRLNRESGKLEGHHMDALAQFGAIDDEVKQIEKAIVKFTNTIVPNFRILPIIEESEDIKKL